MSASNHPSPSMNISSSGNTHRSRRGAILLTCGFFSLVLMYLGYELHTQSMRASRAASFAAKSSHSASSVSSSNSASGSSESGKSTRAGTKKQFDAQAVLDHLMAKAEHSKGLLSRFFVGESWTIVADDTKAAGEVNSNNNNNNNNNDGGLNLMHMYKCLVQLHKRLVPDIPEEEIFVDVSSSSSSPDAPVNNNNNKYHVADAQDDVLYEQHVVRNWKRIQTRFALNSTMLRAFSFCLKGGGLTVQEATDVDESATTATWQDVGSALLQQQQIRQQQQQHSKFHPSASSSVGASHPYFVPLQYDTVTITSGSSSNSIGNPPEAGVASFSSIATISAASVSSTASPRRTILHALRSAEYFSTLMPLRAMEMKETMVTSQQQQDDSKNTDHIAASATSSSSLLFLMNKLDLREATAWKQALLTHSLDHVADAVDSALGSTSRRSKVNASSEQQGRRPTVIVDLGCGHGAMLASICPPHPRLWCYGVDTSSTLIEHGKKFFPHLDLTTIQPSTSSSSSSSSPSSPASSSSSSRGSVVLAPHIPTGTVDAVLSNAVLAPSMRFGDVCGQIEEMLRMLRPAAAAATRGSARFSYSSSSSAVIWGLSLTKSRFSPSFFVDDAGFFLSRDAQDDSFFPSWRLVELRPDLDESQQPRSRKKKNPEQQQQQQQQEAGSSLAMLLSFLRDATANSSSGEGRLLIDRKYLHGGDDDAEEEENGEGGSRRILASKVLSRCGAAAGRRSIRLSDYISRIEIIAGDPALPLYEPRYTRDFAYKTSASFSGAFGVRLFRNSRAFVVEQQQQVQQQASSTDEDAAAIFLARRKQQKQRSREMGGNAGEQRQQQKQQQLTSDTSSLPQTELFAPRGLINCLTSPLQYRICRRISNEEVTAASTCIERVDFSDEEQLKRRLSKKKYKRESLERFLMLGSLLGGGEWCPDMQRKLARRKIRAGMLR